ADLVNDEADFFAHGVGAGLAVADGLLLVGDVLARSFAGAGDDEGYWWSCAQCSRAFGGEGERVERGLARGRELGTDIAARHRIVVGAAFVDAPTFQRLDIDFVE